jgi:hypothetical protein
MWWNFKDQIKEWFLNLLENTEVDITEEDKEQIRLIFKEPGHQTASPTNPEVDRWLREAEQSYMEDEEYEDEEYRDEEEEENY